MEWLALLKGLFGLANPIEKITEAIANTKIAQAQATTDQEKIHSEERISQLQSQRDVLIADSARSSIDLWVRLWLALPPSLPVAKIFVWDKMLGWGSTDRLSPELWYLVYIVYGFYFLHSAIKPWTK